MAHPAIPETPVQIHVMSAISGVQWDEAWPDRAEGTLGTHSVYCLGRDMGIGD